MEDNRPIKVIYSLFPPGKGLIDRRFLTMGQNFGSIEQLVQQYGIDVQIVQPSPHLQKRARRYKKRLKTCYQYSAPKSRLTKLQEKMHFSLTKYSIKPYFR